VPLPKHDERATRSDGGNGCQGHRSYHPESGTYTDLNGKRRSCR
jgi:hypothetical protein